MLHPRTIEPLQQKGIAFASAQHVFARSTPARASVPKRGVASDEAASCRSSGRHRHRRPANHFWRLHNAISVVSRDGSRRIGTLGHFQMLRRYRALARHRRRPPGSSGSLRYSPWAPASIAIFVSRRSIPPSLVQPKKSSRAPVTRKSSAISRNHRIKPDVPLLVPRGEPLIIRNLVDVQPSKNRAGFTSGFLATNPNCSAAGLVLALASPLARCFRHRGPRGVVTMSRLFPAPGYPGVHIRWTRWITLSPTFPGEEEKLESEAAKNF